jgi:4-hydroxy-tetrahydrodipicolinate synthase
MHSVISIISFFIIDIKNIEDIDRMIDRYKGSFVALITPFLNGEIDEVAFQKFVDWQISQGTNGLVPCGTTGESPTLSHDEHKRLIDLTVEVSNNRVPVMAGTGSNSTEEAINLTKYAKIAGADSALIVMPYYNKPTQQGMYEHFKAINDAVELPLFIYNIPGRSVVDMSIETMVKLSKLSNIIGVKDASNDPVRPTLLRNALDGTNFIQFSGEDPSQLPFMASGGDGIISVTGNVAPNLMAEFHLLWNSEKLVEARSLQEKLMQLHTSLFLETSPGPVKYAASLRGISNADLRLPLVEPLIETKNSVKIALQGLELYKIKI